MYLSTSLCVSQDSGHSRERYQIQVRSERSAPFRRWPRARARTYVSRRIDRDGDRHEQARRRRNERRSRSTANAMLLFAATVAVLSADGPNAEAADISSSLHAVRHLQLELEQLRQENSQLRQENGRLSNERQHQPPSVHVPLEQLKGSKPNLLIVFGDDIGYADLNCFGHPTARTPNLDRMAAEGAKLVQYLSAANICSPSRGSLMTGRLYGRLGIWPGTFSPSAVGGLQKNETTLATALRGVGYTSGMVGKVRRPAACILLARARCADLPGNRWPPKSCMWLYAVAFRPKGVFAS